MEPVRCVKAAAPSADPEAITTEQTQATRLLAEMKNTFSAGKTMHNILLNKFQEIKNRADQEQKQQKQLLRDKGPLQQRVDALWTPELRQWIESGKAIPEHVLDIEDPELYHKISK